MFPSHQQKKDSPIACGAMTLVRRTAKKITTMMYIVQNAHNFNDEDKSILIFIPYVATIRQNPIPIWSAWS